MRDVLSPSGRNRVSAAAATWDGATGDELGPLIPHARPGGSGAAFLHRCRRTAAGPRGCSPDRNGVWFQNGTFLLTLSSQTSPPHVHHCPSFTALHRLHRHGPQEALGPPHPAATHLPPDGPAGP